MLSSFVGYAQQNVLVTDNTTTAPHASSLMELNSTTKGFLMPRVALSSTTSQSPIGVAPLTSLLVYNTATAGDVTPGFYYWDGTKWNRFDSGNNIGDWKLLGNAGTNASTNFLGTTDNIDLVFRTNNSEQVRILNTGNVGIGTSIPSYKLDITPVATTGTGIRVTDNGTNSGVQFIAVGDDSYFTDIDLANFLGVYGQQVSSESGIKLGSGGGYLYGKSGNIGIGTTNPNASSLFEVNATNKGVLIPQVSLTATNAASPITSPANSLLVYNSATAGTSPYNVSPGYYYNSGSTTTPNWKRFATGNGDAWLVGGNNFGTSSVAYNFGTISNDHFDFITNNTVRGRVSNLGEFFIGTTNTALLGDLMNGVSNATFPWAVNGYSGNNGSGVYGQVTGGTTLYGGVQGEYYGTNPEGAGVRGLIGNATSGTAFATAINGVTGSGALNATTAGTYKFGVYGRGGYTTRSGGVFGYDFGFGMGALGYYASNAVDYAVYGFGGAYTIGGAAGYNSNGNDNLLASNQIGSNLNYTFGDDETNFNSWSNKDPNSTIGLGIYGGVMGGWIKGLVYGTNLSGAKYGLYVHGKTITNNIITTLTNIGVEERVATYAPSAMKVDVVDRGKSKLKNGKATIVFTDEFSKLLSENEDITITVTPLGSSKGLFVSNYSTTGFTILENESGTSNVDFNWIAIGVKVGFENPEISEEIKQKDFEMKMNGNSGIMYNDNNPEDPKYSIWYDGKKVRFDKPTFIKKEDSNAKSYMRPKNN